MVTYIFIGSKYIAVKKYAYSSLQTLILVCNQTNGLHHIGQASNKNHNISKYNNNNNNSRGGAMPGKAKNSAKDKKKLIPAQKDLSPSVVSETAAHMNYTSSIYL
jgi:hypothetical protein